MEETRLAMLAIVVENMDCTDQINNLLHEYSQYIIGRMGIPYRERKISLISVAIDAPQDVISTLTGKLGNVQGLTVKTAYAKA